MTLSVAIVFAAWCAINLLVNGQQTGSFDLSHVPFVSSSALTSVSLFCSDGIARHAVFINASARSPSFTIQNCIFSSDLISGDAIAARSTSIALRCTNVTFIGTVVRMTAVTINVIELLGRMYNSSFVYEDVKQNDWNRAPSFSLRLIEVRDSAIIVDRYGAISAGLKVAISASAGSGLMLVASNFGTSSAGLELDGRALTNVTGVSLLVHNATRAKQLTFNVVARSFGAVEMMSGSSLLVCKLSKSSFDRDVVNDFDKWNVSSAFATVHLSNFSLSRFPAITVAAAVHIERSRLSPVEGRPFVIEDVAVFVMTLHQLRELENVAIVLRNVTVNARPSSHAEAGISINVVSGAKNVSVALRESTLSSAFRVASVYPWTNHSSVELVVQNCTFPAAPSIIGAVVLDNMRLMNSSVSLIGCRVGSGSSRPGPLLSFSTSVISSSRILLINNTLPEDGSSGQVLAGSAVNVPREVDFTFAGNRFNNWPLEMRLDNLSSLALVNNSGRSLIVYGVTSGAKLDSRTVSGIPLQFLFAEVHTIAVIERVVMVGPATAALPAPTLVLRNCNLHGDFVILNVVMPRFQLNLAAPAVPPGWKLTVQNSSIGGISFSLASLSSVSINIIGSVLQTVGNHPALSFSASTLVSSVVAVSNSTLSTAGFVTMPIGFTLFTNSSVCIVDTLFVTSSDGSIALGDGTSFVNSTIFVSASNFTYSTRVSATATASISVANAALVVNSSIALQDSIFNGHVFFTVSGSLTQIAVDGCRGAQLRFTTATGGVVPLPRRIPTGFTLTEFLQIGTSEDVISLIDGFTNGALRLEGTSFKELNIIGSLVNNTFRIQSETLIDARINIINSTFGNLLYFSGSVHRTNISIVDSVLLSGWAAPVALDSFAALAMSATMFRESTLMISSSSISGRVLLESQMSVNSTLIIERSRLTTARYAMTVSVAGGIGSTLLVINSSFSVPSQRSTNHYVVEVSWTQGIQRGTAGNISVVDSNLMGGLYISVMSGTVALFGTAVNGSVEISVVGQLYGKRESGQSLYAGFLDFLYNVQSQVTPQIAPKEIIAIRRVRIAALLYEAPLPTAPSSAAVLAAIPAEPQLLATVCGGRPPVPIENSATVSVTLAHSASASTTVTHRWSVSTSASSSLSPDGATSSESATSSEGVTSSPSHTIPLPPRAINQTTEAPTMRRLDASDVAPASETTTVAVAATTTIAFSAVASTVGAAGGGGSGDMQALILMGQMACASGAVQDMSKKNAWLVTPLSGAELVEGPSAAGVGQIALLLALFALHLVVTVAFRITRGNKFATFADAAAAARFPSLTITVFNMLHQGLVVEGGRLLWGGVAITARDQFVGALCLLLSCAIPGGLLALVLKNKDVLAYQPYVTLPARMPPVLRATVLPRGFWIRGKAVAPFARAFAAAYATLDGTDKLQYAAVMQLRAIALGVVVTIPFKSCIAQLALVCIVFVAFVAIVAVTQLFRSQLTQWSVYILGVLSSVLPIVFAIPERLGAHATRLTTALVCVSTATTVGSIILWWLERRWRVVELHMKPSPKSSSSPLSAVPRAKQNKAVIDDDGSGSESVEDGDETIVEHPLEEAFLSSSRMDVEMSTFPQQQQVSNPLHR